MSPRVASHANKTRIEPNIVDQNVYWLNTPIAPGEGRTFTVRAKVSPTHPTDSVAISTVVYALDADGNVGCASVMQDATVSKCVYM